MSPRGAVRKRAMAYRHSPILPLEIQAEIEAERDRIFKESYNKYELLFRFDHHNALRAHGMDAQRPALLKRELQR